MLDLKRKDLFLYLNTEKTENNENFFVNMLLTHHSVEIPEMYVDERRIKFQGWKTHLSCVRNCNQDSQYTWQLYIPDKQIK